MKPKNELKQKGWSLWRVYDAQKSVGGERMVAKKLMVLIFRQRQDHGCYRIVINYHNTRKEVTIVDNTPDNNHITSRKGSTTKK
ncbi:hypothetical protein J7I93_24115 [Bacillus sp. ISL-47]|uniref:hypothetical protein n=1 Tax=Bacillus sp. ISL-47 TaxID=2819130 RepID=UPI001BE730DA|nr:hypothetical protein [Bacillus sp. ISL-47]MBT2691224.1 hypothetical protein [Bacillus sp. ISL-47]MBT2711210.1 hypothetical protein [Pseudomonas sp. ISL-84]